MKLRFVINHEGFIDSIISIINWENEVPQKDDVIMDIDMILTDEIKKELSTYKVKNFFSEYAVGVYIIDSDLEKMVLDFLNDTYCFVVVERTWYVIDGEAILSIRLKVVTE